MRKLLYSARGISLISVMIAGTLLTFIFLNLAEFQNLSNKISKKNEKSFDRDQLRARADFIAMHGTDSSSIASKNCGIDDYSTDIIDYGSLASKRTDSGSEVTFEDLIIDPTAGVSNNRYGDINNTTQLGKVKVISLTIGNIKKVVYDEDQLDMPGNTDDRDPLHEADLIVEFENKEGELPIKAITIPLYLDIIMDRDGSDTLNNQYIIENCMSKKAKLLSEEMIATMCAAVGTRAIESPPGSGNFICDMSMIGGCPDGKVQNPNFDPADPCSQACQYKTEGGEITLGPKEPVPPEFFGGTPSC